jgi:hypothetical protein
MSVWGRLGRYRLDDRVGCLNQDLRLMLSHIALGRINLLDHLGGICCEYIAVMSSKEDGMNKAG